MVAEQEQELREEEGGGGGGGGEEEEEMVVDSSDWHRPPPPSFDRPPRRLHHLCHQFRSGSGNNFLKGVRWSPDGSCFLTSSDDNSLRCFTLPSQDLPAPFGDSYAPHAQGHLVMVKEAETVYDFCWYPYMTSADPATSVFASTTRDHPIHLWDSATGLLRCTYRAYDAVDEIAAALSLAFSSSGAKLFAGYDKLLRVFDVHRPGRDYEQHSLLKAGEGFSGIVSSIASSPTHNGMLALGSYNRAAALYAEDNMELLYVLHGHAGGLTQVLFSKDGNYLYTGARKDPYILCWDIRNTVSLVYKLYRSSENTNQRISFDIDPCGGHLGTGGEDGLVHIYDIQTGQWVAGFQAARDTVNGFSFHPFLPLAATSSGHRRFSMPDDCEEGLNLSGDDNCASVWEFFCASEVENDADVCYTASVYQTEDTNQTQENP